MENTKIEHQDVLNVLYALATDLIINKGMSYSETIKELIAAGLDAENAKIMVSNIKEEYKKAKKENANKDIIYGLMWFGGGLLLSFSGIGLIFIGAIVFGAIQFFKGIFNL